MKKYLVIGVVFLLTAIAVLTAKGGSPFPPWVNQLTADYLPLGQGDQEGHFVPHRARFIYDVSTDGGSVAAHSLGVYLPGSAVLLRSYLQILTPFTSGASGGGTVALSCEDANNIKTATDLTGSAASAFIEGQSTGTAATFVRSIAAPCEITATVASTAQTAGKLVGWIDYVIGQ